MRRTAESCDMGTQRTLRGGRGARGATGAGVPRRRARVALRLMVGPGKTNDEKMSVDVRVLPFFAQ